MARLSSRVARLQPKELFIYLWELSSEASGRLIGVISRIGRLIGIKRAGLVLIGLEGIALVVWSWIQYRRFSETWDFSIYYQAFWQIAHGHINPYDTLNGFYFWQNHFELLMWPLSLLWWIWPHAVILSWIQDLSIVAAQAVGWIWSLELLGGINSIWLRRIGALAVLSAMVGNPFWWWTASWDFHLEVVAAPVFVIAARELWLGRRRGWLWSGVLLSCGAVVTTYVFALGVGLILFRRRRPGLVLAAVGAILTLIEIALHANQGGSLVGLYGYLLGSASLVKQPSSFTVLASMISHPLHDLSLLMNRRADLWANVAAAGVLGVACPLFLPLVIVVEAVNGLTYKGFFLPPGFQSAILYAALPVGGAWVIARLAEWPRRGVKLLAGSLAVASGAYTAGWAAVWLPRFPSTWTRVSPAASQVLSDLRSRIPISDEVIASQGVGGRFSGRKWIYLALGPATFPVHTRTVWFVIAPEQGIEVQSSIAAQAWAGQLSRTTGCTLVAAGAGIWGFRCSMQASHKSRVLIPGVPSQVPGWVVVGPAGTAVLSGSPKSWYAESRGTPGYLVSYDYWKERSGNYVASVKLEATGAFNVEVWDATTSRLIARDSLPRTNGIEELRLPFSLSDVRGPGIYDGPSLFRVDWVAPPRKDQLEIRVFDYGSGKVKVFDVGMTKER